MKAFKLNYPHRRFEIVYGNDSLEIIKRYDLASRHNYDTRVIELTGEQRAIAMADYWEEQD